MYAGGAHGGHRQGGNRPVGAVGAGDLYGKNHHRQHEGSLEPTKYHDEYRQRLWEIIQAKANNQEITATPEAPSSNIINMMDALQQMVELAKGKNTPPKKPRSRKKVSAS